MAEIDYNDPSAYTVKYVEDPAAWPGNGPPWLFEDSTPEEIAHMQQMATDDAIAAEIAAQTPPGVDRIDPVAGTLIPKGLRPDASNWPLPNLALTVGTFTLMPTHIKSRLR